MKSLINIDADDDFNFGSGARFPLTIKGGAEEIRDWIWNNYSKLYVTNSAERQKDHIKLHRGNRIALIERELEKMYKATYVSKKYYSSCGNWTFEYKIL